jgi:hypothetical protein
LRVGCHHFVSTFHTHIYRYMVAFSSRNVLGTSRNVCNKVCGNCGNTAI